MKRNTHLEEFMNQFPFEGLTFDDILLITQYADFLPHETDISSRLTSRIDLNIPFLSAAMDTVTESKMAIEMAMMGGIGVIHKNLPADEQARQVGMVKHHLNGLIFHPICFNSGDTLENISEVRRKKGFTFSGFPILDAEKRVVGIISSTDVRFTTDNMVRVDDVMTTDVITAPPNTTLEQAYEIMIASKIGKLPLVDSNGRLEGLYSFTDVSNLVKHTQPLYNRDKKHRLRVAAAVGPNDQQRVEILADQEVDVFVVDSAHGHSKGIIEMVRWISKHYPDIDVIGGNVATGEGAVALRDAGAHAVKVGIGPGSICTTRVVCGVGVPQISAIYDAARALDGSIPVIGDGGIRHSGDVPKAIAAGASTVMLGSILAGTEESPGEKIIHQGRHYVVYRGMGSLAAMEQSKGSRERYAQISSEPNALVPQGIEGIVPYAGRVTKVMTQFCGGLRSALGYTGAHTVAELQQNARMIRITSAGVGESHPHDVKIMKEAPNYRS